MADSIDRVFAHALQTVRKIPRTGSARPPPSDRLKLYGLYKQSMEGDVAGVMERPSLATATVAITSEADLTREERAEVAKWDAWSSCAGLTRSEAKCKYIDVLISTMHIYAYGTPEARELVNELEFVWDQVRSNTLTTNEEREEPRTKEGLRLLRPMSDQDENEEEEDDDDDENNSNEEPKTLAPTRRRKNMSSSWQSRVDGALVQMTAEIAALREVVEARSRRMWSIKPSTRQNWMRWAINKMWRLCTRVLVDAVFVACVLVVLKWRSGGVQEVVRFWSECKDRVRQRLVDSGTRAAGIVVVGKEEKGRVVGG